MIGDSAPLHRLGFHPDTHASRRVRGFPPIKLTEELRQQITTSLGESDPNDFSIL